MADVRVSHEFDCDEDTYWTRCFFDEEYNRRLFLDELRFPSWKVTRHEETPAAILRTVEMQLLVENLPAAMQRLMGDRLGYVEEGTWDRATRVYRYRITPTLMPEKTRIEGVFRVERLGDKKIRRTSETHVEVKVFGIGGMIEDRTIADTKRNFEATAQFTRRFLVEKGL